MYFGFGLTNAQFQSGCSTNIEPFTFAGEDVDIRVFGAHFFTCRRTQKYGDTAFRGKVRALLRRAVRPYFSSEQKEDNGERCGTQMSCYREQTHFAPCESGHVQEVDSKIRTQDAQGENEHFGSHRMSLLAALRMTAPARVSAPEPMQHSCLRQCGRKILTSRTVPPLLAVSTFVPGAENLPRSSSRPAPATDPARTQTACAPARIHPADWLRKTADRPS